MSDNLTKLADNMLSIRQQFNRKQRKIRQSTEWTFYPASSGPVMFDIGYTGERPTKQAEVETTVKALTDGQV